MAADLGTIGPLQGDPRRLAGVRAVERHLGVIERDATDGRHRRTGLFVASGDPATCSSLNVRCTSTVTAAEIEPAACRGTGRSRPCPPRYRPGCSAGRARSVIGHRPRCRESAGSHVRPRRPGSATSRAATSGGTVLQVRSMSSSSARSGSISLHRRTPDSRSVVQIPSWTLTSPVSARRVLRAIRRASTPSALATARRAHGATVAHVGRCRR